MSETLIRPLFEGPIDVVGDVHGEIDALQAAIKDVIVGGVDVLFLFLGARALRITELTSLVSSLTARLRRA